MNWNFGISDALIILATILGPITAVQAQKILERLHQKNESKRKIFSILMATRGNRTSLEHVQALNSIPIEFYGKDKKLIEICEHWRKYINHLSTRMNDGDAWSNKLDEIYAEMLLSISAYLQYNFTYTQIKKEGYFPQIYQNVESEQFLLRLAMMESLNGKSKIKVEIHDGHKNRDSQGAEAP